MAKLKYRFNAETLSFELHHESSGKRLKRFLILFTSSALLSIVCFMLYSHFFDTPKILSLQQSNTELLLRFELLRKQITIADDVLSELQKRDNNIYRPTFGLAEIPSSIRNAGFGGIDRYAHFEQSMYADILEDCAKHLDKLLRKVCIQSMSFDTVAQNAIIIGQMVDCVPAIQPVAQAIPRITSFFGVRNDPMWGDLRAHEGIDIAGRIGEVIFATGNGKIVGVEHSFSGYGNMVLIDHGFGYKTRYAHLHTIIVREGEYVNRGQQVGTLGSTGKSTGPHLHYEVLLRDKPVNPLNFFTSDINSSDIVAIMHVANSSDMTKEYD